MAEAIIFEFDELAPDQYQAVALGLDALPGGSDRPAGLLSHTGAATAGGGIILFEVWDSQASQEAFMESRLGPVLAEAGLPPPSRMEWLTMLAHYSG